MTTDEILDAAADLIATHGWTQGELARDPDGCPVGSVSTRATCWCAVGAIAAVVGSDNYTAASSRATEALAEVVGTGYPHEWNDDDARTRAEVVRAMREAAERVREGRA